MIDKTQQLKWAAFIGTTLLFIVIPLYIFWSPDIQIPGDPEIWFLMTSVMLWVHTVPRMAERKTK